MDLSCNQQNGACSLSTSFSSYGTSSSYKNKGEGFMCDLTKIGACSSVLKWKYIWYICTLKCQQVLHCLWRVLFILIIFLNIGTLLSVLVFSKLLSLLCLVGHVQFKYRIMGRKAGSLYINPKKFSSLHKPCMKEMIAFLNCLAVNNNSNDKCVRQKELLSVCMDSQVILLFWFIVAYSSPIFLHGFLLLIFHPNFFEILIIFFWIIQCSIYL